MQVCPIHVPCLMHSCIKHGTCANIAQNYAGFIVAPQQVHIITYTSIQHDVNLYQRIFLQRLSQVRCTRRYSATTSIRGIWGTRTGMHVLIDLTYPPTRASKILGVCAHAPPCACASRFDACLGFPIYVCTTIFIAIVGTEA
jgi:hypothetical protein